MLVHVNPLFVYLQPLRSLVSAPTHPKTIPSIVNTPLQLSITNTTLASITLSLTSEGFAYLRVTSQQVESLHSTVVSLSWANKFIFFLVVFVYIPFLLPLLGHCGPRRHILIILRLFALHDYPMAWTLLMISSIATASAYMFKENLLKTEQGVQCPIFECELQWNFAQNFSV